MPRQIDFEGTLHEFPDDFSDADVQKALASVRPAAAPAAPAAPTRAPAVPLVDAAGSHVAHTDPGYDAMLGTQQNVPSRARSVGIGVQGAGRGMADIAGAPVDIASLMLNLGAAGAEGAVNLALPPERQVAIPRIQNPVGGSQNIADLFSRGAETVGMPLVEPADMSSGERMTYNVNRYGAQGAASGAALAAKAATAAPQTLGTMMREYATNPLGTVAVDTGAGVGAGVGATVANDLKPNSPIADFIGTLLGALTGARATQVATAPAKVGQTAFNAATRDPKIPVDPETGAATSRSTSNMAREYVQGQAADPQTAAQVIAQESERYRATGPEMPTTGILSSDPGMIALENRSRLENPTPFIRNDQQLRTAAGAEVRSLSPGDGVDPRAATNFARSETDRELAGARNQTAQAEGRLQQSQQQLQAEQEAVTNARPDVVRTNAGAEARTAIEAAKEVDDEAMRAAYGAVDPALPANFANTHAAATAARREVGATGTVPPIIDRIIAERAADAQAPRTFAELQADMRNVNQGIREANAAGRVEDARLLGNVRDGITADLDAMGAASAPLRAANARYRDEFSPKYRQGASRDVLKTDQGGAPKVPPSETIDRYMGSPEEAARLRTIIGNDQNGQRAVRDWFVNNLATKSPSTGPNAAFVDRWLDSNSALLEQFPAVRTEVQQMRNRLRSQADAVGTLETDVANARQRQGATEQNVQNSAMSKLLDTEPTKAVTRVFGANDPQTAMREIVARLKTDPSGDALKGWKKAVADHMEQKLTTTATGQTLDGSAPVSQAKLANLFKQNEKVLSELYDASEMNSLRRAQKLIEPLNRLSTRATAGSPTAEYQNMLMGGLEIGFKSIYGGLRGGNMFRNFKLAMNTFGGASKEGEIKRLVERMQFDPELAQHMLTTPVDELKIPAWNKKLSKLMAVEAAAAENVDSDK